MAEKTWEEQLGEQEQNEIRYRRETFWFNVIVWGLISTIPVGLITMAAGALVVGMVFMFIGLGSALLMVLSCLFMIG